MQGEITDVKTQTDLQYLVFDEKEERIALKQNEYLWKMRIQRQAKTRVCMTFKTKKALPVNW